MSKFNAVRKKSPSDAPHPPEPPDAPERDAQPAEAPVPDAMVAPVPSPAVRGRQRGSGPLCPVCGSGMTSNGQSRNHPFRVIHYYKCLQAKCGATCRITRRR